jgi:hypothetical protein
MDEKNGKIAHQRMLAGRRILRNLGRNNNSPGTGRGYKNLGYLLLKAQRIAVTKAEFIVLRKAA